MIKQIALVLALAGLAAAAPSYNSFINGNLVFTCQGSGCASPTPTPSVAAAAIILNTQYVPQTDLIGLLVAGAAFVLAGYAMLTSRKKRSEPNKDNPNGPD